jgi:hypothetical protein
MTATLDELRAALHDAARNYAPPPEVTLRQVEHRVVATDRRRRVLLSGVLAAVVAIAAAAISSGSYRAEPPATPGPSQSANATPQEPAFPESVNGLRRITIVDVPLVGGSRAAVSLHADPGRRLVASAYCTGTGDPAPEFWVTSGSWRVALQCQEGPVGGVPTSHQGLWSPDSADPTVSIAPPRGTSRAGAAWAAIYQEVPWENYAFPPRPSDLATNPHTAWSDYQRGLSGPKDPSTPNAPRTMTVPYVKDLLLSLSVRAPGTVRATVNGRAVMFGCNRDPDNLVHCGNLERLGKTVRVWGYGAFSEVFTHLDEPASLDPGDPDYGIVPGKPIHITVYPSGFTGDDWRLWVGVWRG